MSDQRGMRSHSSSRTLLEYQDGTVINLHKATTLPLLPIISRICAYLSLSREILDIIYRLCRFPLAAPRGVGRAVARLLHYVFIFTVLVQFILSGVAGVTSHLASQVHTVARNTHSITLAVCALPVPFKNVFCAGISNGLLSPLNPSVDKSLSWHPFLINEDIHGPAVDFAIRKTTNATSVVLALVRASDLTQRHELSDKLKDFLQRAWASELSSGSHVALVKTVIDEMLLEHNAIFAKLQADLHPGLLSRLVAFNWAHRSKQATLEALALVEDTTTAHARRLVMHGDSVYHGLRFLESIALEISGLLAAEGAAIHQFLDVEAIVAAEDEEETDEGEILSGLFDDEEMSNDEADVVSHAGLSDIGTSIKDLQDEATRIVATARNNTRSSYTTFEDIPLPFRVPRSTDPSIWSVRVKLGQETDVVFQICRRCLAPSEIHPPAIASAFALSSIPGYVFIEAFDVREVRHVVKGLVIIRDKQPQFIAPTEYVGILSHRHKRSAGMEVGQWVRCIAGRYRNDVGYLYESDISIQGDVVVIFVPRIPQSGGKRKRDGRPAPQVWTIAELAQQYGQRKVKVLGPNKFVFRGSVYEDGLVMEHIPSSYLRVLGYSPQNITPFVQSAMVRSHPPFYPCLKRFVQDSTQVGDRILVVSGEYAGIIGRTKRIQDNVADVVTQSPEQHSGLIIRVALRDLIPYFLPGDNVKNRWTDSFGMVVAIDNVEQKVTFLDREANAEIDTSTLSIQFFSSPLRFFRFTPGLYVEFPGKGGATHRGRILQVPDGSIAQVIDEVSGQHINIDLDDITVSGVQAAALHRSEHRRIWEGKRVMITKGSLKGYHGLVKAEDPNGVDVELDAKIASHGLAKQHFQYGEFQVEPISMPVVASLSRLNRTPPPEDVPRAITPEPEEPEENTSCSRVSLQGLTRTHWLFAEEIQGVLREECIPFHVWGIPALSPHTGLNGFTAKTVPVVNQKILPEPNEVIVSVVQRRKPTQISIDPSNLVPWTPSEGNKVVIIGRRCTGQVGKLLKLEHECCTIELESSGEITLFMVEDVANVLKI
ncbi:hypothetical protein EDB85DRAFT_2158192 [Lactarius pseudohatsudake]|nr:hypothetical protein EDB85DRAFT_2158192 [Lactarius pseudohatsudake]